MLRTHTHTHVQRTSLSGGGDRQCFIYSVESSASCICTIEMNWKICVTNAHSFLLLVVFSTVKIKWCTVHIKCRVYWNDIRNRWKQSRLMRGQKSNKTHIDNLPICTCTCECGTPCTESASSINQCNRINFESQSSINLVGRRRRHDVDVTDHYRDISRVRVHTTKMLKQMLTWLWFNDCPIWMCVSYDFNGRLNVKHITCHICVSKLQM